MHFVTDESVYLHHSVGSAFAVTEKRLKSDQVNCIFQSRSTNLSFVFETYRIRWAFCKFLSLEVSLG